MPSAGEPLDAVVIGGGIIGAACALALRRIGWRVMLIDRTGHTGGCAAGSAGVLATSFVLPLSDAAMIVAAPAMLLRRTGPLAMRLRHLPHYAGWLARFARNATAARRRASIDALKRLNGQAIRAWGELLGPAASARLIHTRGMLDVLRPRRSPVGLRERADHLRSEGIRIDVLDAMQVAELEPALQGRTGGGLFHPDVAHVVDPRAVSDALVTTFAAEGGTLVEDEVRSLEPHLGATRVHGSRVDVHSRRVLIAAGCWSRNLIAQFGIRVPLCAERGYHIMASSPRATLSRPVSFHEESFLATPLPSGLRLAGTVELAPPTAPARWSRATVLADLARAYLPDLQADPTTSWFGSRPSLPDSLPAIGALRAHPSVMYAFGHQHLGLTQAAITAELVRDVALNSPSVELGPFSVERFS